METSIYIAATFESKDRLQPVRRQIQNLGFTVNSTWLDEASFDEPIGDSAENVVSPEQATKYAERDIDEIMKSELLILDTTASNARGGSQVEYGIAHIMGLQTWVVGPARNVFNRLADRHFESWDEALAALERGEADPFEIVDDDYNPEQATKCGERDDAEPA